METTTIPLTTLLKKPATYKMIIPKEVERKIRYALYEANNIEWSGPLFYTYEGSFKDNNLVITCKDFLVMDIGNSVYTEFEYAPEVISYMTDNDLLDCQIGNIHSHHTMGTTFSSTDLNTLSKEGNSRNNFLSLIVNNAGTYNAAITKKVSHIYEETSSKYGFFGEGEVISPTKNTIENTDIEYYYFDIEVEEDYSIKETKERFAKIKSEKAVKNNSTEYKGLLSTTNNYSTNTNYYKLWDDIPENNFTQSSTPFVETMDDNFGINPMLIKSLLTQLITGSIFSSDNTSIDLNRLSKSLPTLCEKRFGKGNKGLDNYKIWAEYYIEYLTWYVEETGLEGDFTQTEICSIICESLVDKLNKLPNNEYIDILVKELEKYIKL